MAKSIDLNCDLGEGIGSDEAILPYITSVNIVCGGHAGNPATMRETVRLAIEHSVSIGAHPGLPDPAGFGRREIQMTPLEVYNLVLEQALALAAIVRAAGTAVTHLKPHGALYNMAARDAAIAEAIAAATHQFDQACILFGLAGSELIKAGEIAGLMTASETFADRTYQADGSLTPRTSPDALIHDPAAAAERVLKMVLQGTVTSQHGTEIPLRAETICIHGDSPGAAEMAKAVRERLRREGVEVKGLAARIRSGSDHAQ
jgi:5-oxoprolinase (ATP-hydrolysing) subunit A